MKTPDFTTTIESRIGTPAEVFNAVKECSGLVVGRN